MCNKPEARTDDTANAGNPGKPDTWPGETWTQPELLPDQQALELEELDDPDELLSPEPTETVSLDCTRGDDFEFLWRAAMFGGLTFSPNGDTNWITLKGPSTAIALLCDLRDALNKTRILKDLERESKKQPGTHYHPPTLAVRDMTDARVLA